jgi:uncharacterized protein (TIGR03085 family)
MAWTETERAALVATFRHADPEAPTLCEGWNVRRLLAHLVQREHSPWRRAGDELRKSAPGAEKNLGPLADSARTPEGYQALLQRFAAGTSSWSPMTWLGDAVQLLEYVVHHEDVRRATDPPADPRVLPPGEEQALWQRLGGLAKLAYRGCPVGVELALPDGRRRTVRKGPDAVLLTGAAVELALHAFGRHGAAHVRVDGSPDAVRKFADWALAS